jgi:hypothetical protein
LKAYVYAIVVDGVIRYVGKGSGSHVRAHMRVVRSIARRRATGELVQASYFYNGLTKAWLAGAEIEERILIADLDHEAAFRAEIETIASFPRDQLWNCWPGGEGSSKGYAKSEQQRRKIAESNKQTWADPKLRAEQSARMRLVLVKSDVREKLHKPRSEQFCRKMHANAKARWADPDFRDRVKVKFSTEEARAKRSEATKRAWEKRRARQIGG